MRRLGHLEVSGDLLAFSQNLLLLELLFTPAERQRGAAAAAVGTPYVEDVVGRYLHLDLDGRTHRVYFEEAGAGTPLDRRWLGAGSARDANGHNKCQAQPDKS